MAADAEKRSGFGPIPTISQHLRPFLMWFSLSFRFSSRRQRARWEVGALQGSHVVLQGEVVPRAGRIAHLCLGPDAAGPWKHLAGGRPAAVEGWGTGRAGRGFCGRRQDARVRCTKNADPFSLTTRDVIARGRRTSPGDFRGGQAGQGD